MTTKPNTELKSAEEVYEPAHMKLIRVKLPCGATATVSKDISARGLEALDEMMRTAMRNVGSKTGQILKGEK